MHARSLLHAAADAEIHFADHPPPIQYVKGIGSRIASILGEKGMSTVEDLLYYLPFRYEDRANPKSIAELRVGEMASIIAEVRASHLYRTKNGMPIFELVVGQG